MSKVHFDAAARFIRLHGRDDATRRAMADLIIAIQDNAHFDRGRFLKACGIVV